MKTATIIFVALTVFSGLFLESSSAPSLLEGIVPIVKNPGNEVDGLVENTLETLQGSTKLLATVLKEVIALHEGIDEKISEETVVLLEELIEALKAAGEVLPELLTELENRNNVAVQKLQVILSKLIKKIKAIIANLLEKVGDEVKELLEKVLQVVKKILKALKPIVKELFTGVKDILSKLIVDLAGILKNIKELLADAKGDLKELLIEIFRLLKELLEKLRDLIKAFVALLANVTDESLNKIYELLKETEDISLKVKVILESQSGKAIGNELVGSILVLLDTINKVKVNLEVMVQILIA